MSLVRRFTGAVWMLGAVAVAGCGTSGGDKASEFDSPNGGGAAPGDPSQSTSIAGADTGPVSTDSACVSSSANAALRPVNLVFMYDKSGSMGDPGDGFDPNARWVPVSTGLKAFFADPGSAGISASLQFFPLGGDVDGTCKYDYATPMVALTPISDGAVFEKAIASTSPYGGTPTLPALEGAIHYAQSLASTRASDKTVVVLVTDGEPGYRIDGQNVPGCPSNDITHVAQAAATALAATPPTSTYVIGVGPSLDKLNAIASAGGTGKAFMVSVADPARTKGDFEAALDKIREETVSCDFSIPQPPDGKTLNTDRVNVIFTTGAGKENPLAYSKDCGDGSGWHYDNAAAPTHITLCPTICSSSRADRSGKLTIAFGCKTHGETR